MTAKEINEAITKAIKGAFLEAFRAYKLEKSGLSKNVTIRRVTGGFDVWLLDYWKWVEAGRRPGVTKVPIGPLIEWIKRKRLPLRGRSINAVAFAIQSEIFKRGIKARPFLKTAAQRSGEEIEKIITNYFEVEFLKIQWQK